MALRMTLTTGDPLSLFKARLSSGNDLPSIGPRYIYPEGKTYHGDKLDNRSYRSYGQPVYAVADGIITDIKDGIPENIPGANARAVGMTVETVPGNHVIEKIAESTYAAFAHLQSGSLKVKLGDHLRRGQVLGLLGNSGNSSGPHLHFQICDANSVLACEGLPYALAAFEVEGSWEARCSAREARDGVTDPSSDANSRSWYVRTCEADSGLEIVSIGRF